MKTQINKFFAICFACTLGLCSLVEARDRVPVVEDAYIGSFPQTIDENFGNRNGLSVAARGNGVNITFLKVDATTHSGLETIGGLSLYNLTTAPNLTIRAYLLADLDPDSWNQSSITWANAPAVGTGFTLDESVRPMLLGERSSWTSAGRNEIAFTNDSGVVALLEQLNSGSRQATIVLTGSGWVSGTMNFYSIEESTIDTEPYLVVE